MTITSRARARESWERGHTPCQLPGQGRPGAFFSIKSTALAADLPDVVHLEGLLVHDVHVRDRPERPCGVRDALRGRDFRGHVFAGHCGNAVMRRGYVGQAGRRVGLV